MNLTNRSEDKIVPIMHGENFLQPVAALPKGQTTKAKMYIAGHSETGHHHVLESKADMEILETGSDRYVLIKEVATLFHKKSYDIHETVTIEPGVYKITHKTEYDPFAQVRRAVWD
jgi:hypothetical protein